MTTPASSTPATATLDSAPGGALDPLNWPGAIAKELPGVDDASKLAAVVFGIFASLADKHMWASLSWIVIGVNLFILGLILWLKKPAMQAVGYAAKAAAVVG